MEITSKPLVEIWQRFGIYPRKSMRELYPQLLLDADEEITRQFIKGVFDGDGSLMLDPSPCFQIVGTEELTAGIQRQLIRFVPGLRETKLTNNIKGANHYALRYRGSLQVPRIMDWIYFDSHWHLDRKYGLYLRLKEQQKRT